MIVIVTSRGISPRHIVIWVEDGSFQTHEGWCARQDSQLAHAPPPHKEIKQREAKSLSDRPNLIVCSAFGDVRVVRNLRLVRPPAAPTRAIGLCAHPILLRLASLNFSPSACASPRAPASATSFGPQGLPPPQPGPQESHVLEPRISHHRRGHRTVPPV